MEHREEATLAEDLARAPLPVPELLRRTVEIASAMNRLHRQGRVHGHIEPSSIVITPDGVEFAEPVAEPQLLTPYTAPEQLRGATDARSDIFAFGAIVFELATGWKAFAGDTPEDLKTAILERQPPAIAGLVQDPAHASVYATLDRLVATCLVKDPDRRRQRMQNVMVELKLLAGSSGRPAPAARVQRAPGPAAASVPPPRQTTPKQLLPESRDEARQPAPVPQPVPFLGEIVARLPLEERSAPNALPTIPEAAPLTVEPVPPYPEEGGPAEPPAPSPGATAEMPPAETSEAADAPPLPGAAERRASELLSQVGFGEEPAYLIDESQRPGRRWWKGKVRIQTSKAEARVWIRVLKIFAVILLIGIAIVASIIVARGAVRSVVRLWNERARTGTAAPLGALRFALPAPEQASYLSSPAISPDGSLLAFSAVDASRKRLLWIRPLNSLRATPLADTDDALAPFWSPDGRYLGFFSGKKLKKIAAGGGGPTVLCDTEGLAGGGAWNREGVIVFGRGFYDSLYKVSAAGGTPEPVTRLESSRGERAHLWPRFLPDGKHFLLFTLSERDENNGISIGSLDGKETHHLLVADTNAIYAELNTPASTLKGGYLIFAQGHHLNARPFDPLNLELKGEGFTIADEINYLDFINLLPISASDNGLLAYQNIDTPKRQLVWLDRDGNQIGSIGDPAEYGQARISPDGTHVAVNRLSPANRETADIWIFDVQTNAAKQFTNTSAHEGSPVWSPDGTQIVYFGNPNGPFNLYRKSFVKAGDEELLLSSNEDKYPNDCSPDGKYLLFGSVAASTNSDLLIMAATGARKPSVYLQTVSSEGYAQFSPDGKWIAYQSDESRRAEVYVEPFPRADGKSRRWQISTDGGGLPRWRHDGRELYYIMGNGKMMAVTVTTGSNFTAEAPRQLFQTRALPRTWNLFDVSRDGSRFLVNIPLEWASSSPITVIANWTEGFKAEP